MWYRLSPRSLTIDPLKWPGSSITKVETRCVYSSLRVHLHMNSAFRYCDVACMSGEDIRFSKEFAWNTQSEKKAWSNLENSSARPCSWRTENRDLCYDLRAKWVGEQISQYFGAHVCAKLFFDFLSQPAGILSLRSFLEISASRLWKIAWWLGFQMLLCWAEVA